MRAAVVLAAAGLVLAVAGCGSSGGKPIASADKYGPASDPVSLSKCMRGNGVPNFPDPVNGGLPIVSSSPGTLTVEGTAFAGPAFTHAEKACKEYLPGANGPPPPPSAEQLRQELAVAKCVRRNGVPNFPDPGSKGLGKVVVADSGSPGFQHAVKVCAGLGGSRFSIGG